MKWAVVLVGTVIVAALMHATELSALENDTSDVSIVTADEPSYPVGSIIIDSFDVGQQVTLSSEDAVMTVKEYVSIINTTDMPLDLATHHITVSYAKSTSPCDELTWAELPAATNMPALPDVLPPYQSFMLVLNGLRLHNTSPGVLRITEQQGDTEMVHDMAGWQGDTEAAQCSEGRPAVLDDFMAARQFNTYNHLPVDTDDNAYDFNASPEAPVTAGPPVAEDVPEETLPPIELEDATITINEVLPDPSRPDSSDEFIELYNPGDQPVSLVGYRLETGTTFGYSYEIPDIVLLPGEYKAFYADVTNLSLSNVGSNVRLTAPSGRVTSEMAYTTSDEDTVWAWTGTEWLPSLTATPGAANLISAPNRGEDVTAAPTNELSACDAGKYRNPLTNRCRAIESSTSTLSGCDADEYRNPETNRCRKIAVLATALVPCSEGSERNPETNRCRKVAGVSTSLKPCQTGYERNPTTNRCRKMAAAVGGAAATASPPAEEADAAPELKTALITTASIGAIGYGLYEWRSEVGRALRRLRTLIASR